MFVDFEDQATALAALERRLTLAGRELVTHPVDFYAQQRERELLYHQRPGEIAIILHYVSGRQICSLFKQ